jgi:SPP1 family predicted phage head-tail adaptor
VRTPDPGELRQVLIYQDAVETLDATGSTVESIVDRFVVRAKVDPLSGREAYQAAQAQSDATHDVILRYRPGIAAGGRFAFRDQPSRVLQIESVRNLEERSTWLACRCIEGRA